MGNRSQGLLIRRVGRDSECVSATAARAWFPLRRELLHESMKAAQEAPNRWRSSLGYSRSLPKAPAGEESSQPGLEARRDFRRRRRALRRDISCTEYRIIDRSASHRILTCDTARIPERVALKFEEKGRHRSAERRDGRENLSTAG